MTNFLGLRLKTTKDTFIPRPETALLVRRALLACEELWHEGRSHCHPEEPEMLRRATKDLTAVTDKILRRCCATAQNDSHWLDILDIGTGSGNIAILLTKRSLSCKIVALDASDEALSVAGENAEAHDVSGRIEFVKSDLYSGIEGRKFDIIVSNPPYIPTWEIETLSEAVKSEPRAALDGGDDGLAYYNKIISLAPGFLKDGGYIILETGYNQSLKVKDILGSNGFNAVEVSKDPWGVARVIEARWINS